MTTARVAGAIEPTTQQAIAAQLRAELARLDISARELARRMGVGHTWVTDRRKGEVTITVEDVIRMAPHLGLNPADLFEALTPRIGAADSVTPEYAPVTGADMVPCPGRNAIILPFARRPRTPPTRSNTVSLVG